ncbi:MAG: efflux transporter, family, subunit [Bryobacterales bacterium]|nr:efflux transporter, family, subunit [Bryobacterales bacterium]
MSKIHVYLTAACLAILIACSGKPKDTAKGGEAEPVFPVEVAPVKREAIHQLVTAEAVLFPINQANVMPKISAPVRRFLVNRGDHVSLGQVVAVLEDRDLAAAALESKSLYNQAQATFQTTTGATMPDDLTKAQSDVQSAREALTAAQKVYENRVALVKEGALAQKLADDAKVALVQAQSQAETAQRHLQSLQTVARPETVKGAQAQVDAAKAHYQSLEAQASYAEVRSPINGVVSDRPVSAGEIANAGAALISIVDISQLVARANVPVKDAAAIRVGKAATITGPGGQLTGKVTVVSPAVDPSTTTVEVWVQASNRGEVLKPGVTVQVAIAASTVGDALVVPAAALLNLEEGGEKVMIVGPDSVAHEQKVEVGIREGDRVQLLSGVKESDQVIVSGGLGLEDKAKVKVAGGEKDDKKDKDDEKK